jgi:hypothetical protein
MQEWHSTCALEDAWKYRIATTGARRAKGTRREGSACPCTTSSAATYSRVAGQSCFPRITNCYQSPPSVCCVLGANVLNKRETLVIIF